MLGSSSLQRQLRTERCAVLLFHHKLRSLLSALRQFSLETHTLQAHADVREGENVKDAPRAPTQRTNSLFAFLLTISGIKVLGPLTPAGYM